MAANIFQLLWYIMDSSKIEDLLVKDDNFMDLLLFDIEKVRRNG